MTLLKSRRAYDKWAKGVNSGQPQSPIQPPAEFPCYAYLTVASFGYEEERAEYLYSDDLQKMLPNLSTK